MRGYQDGWEFPKVSIKSTTAKIPMRKNECPHGGIIKIWKPKGHRWKEGQITKKSCFLYDIGMPQKKFGIIEMLEKLKAEKQWSW